MTLGFTKNIRAHYADGGNNKRTPRQYPSAAGKAMRCPFAGRVQPEPAQVQNVYQRNKLRVLILVARQGAPKVSDLLAFREKTSIKMPRIAAIILLAVTGSAFGNMQTTVGELSAVTSETSQHIHALASENEDPAAMYALANLFDEGRGITQNYEKAFEWYQRAADRGSVEAMNCLGIAYAMGKGVSQNDELSFRWFTSAIEKGSIDAINNVGKAYFTGTGRPVDYAEAANWFALAASKSDVDAMNNLALMYVKGIGVLQNRELGIALFSFSARQGYALAMMNLGILFAEGEVVAKDDAVAFAWLATALQAGLRGGERVAVVRYLDMLAHQLEPDELARAQKMVAEISAAVIRNATLRNPY